LKKDAGSSKTSNEVNKPTGVKIKTEVETVKPKVSILPLYLEFPFDLDSEYLIFFNLSFIFRAGKGITALRLCPLLQRSRSKQLHWVQK
jgi:hypothetical protein